MIIQYTPELINYGMPARGGKTAAVEAWIKAQKKKAKKEGRKFNVQRIKLT